MRRAGLAAYDLAYREPASPDVSHYCCMIERI
jgi:hypothetical protein